MEDFFVVLFKKCDQLLTQEMCSNREEFRKYVLTTPAAAVSYWVPQQITFQEGIQDLPFLHVPSARLELTHRVPSLHFRGASRLEQRKRKSSSPALSQALGQLCRWSNYRGTRGTPGGPDGAAGRARTHWGQQNRGLGTLHKSGPTPSQAAREARVVQPETPTGFSHHSRESLY